MDPQAKLRDLAGIQLPILTAQVPRQTALRLFENHEALQALPVRLQRDGQVWRLTRRTFLQLCATDRQDYLRPTMKHLEPASVLAAQMPIMELLSLDPPPEFPIFREASDGQLVHVSLATCFQAFSHLFGKVELGEPPRGGRAAAGAGAGADGAAPTEEPAGPALSWEFDAALIGSSAEMRALREKAARLARTRLPAFISGPAGSGKTLLAMVIHRASGLPASCCRVVHVERLDAAATEDLLHLLEAATGPAGTLILKSFEGMPAVLQRCLVRHLDEAHPGGAPAWRLLALSRKPPEAIAGLPEVDPDLLRRVSLVHLAMPPLQRRRQDIPQLVEHFCARYGALAGRPVRPHASAMRRLQYREYTSHVREIEDLMQRFVIESDRAVLDRQALQALGAGPPDTGHSEAAPLSPTILKETVARAEREALSLVLASTRGNLSEAARFLGLDRAGLHRKLKRLGLRVGS
ncbi:MAG: sigma-54-dependent Fis family transcriptional regulator [Candidatus Tectomicrobia bacterium]|nr:sigma-54-dependent Fis family transcriptional regulator [Candidatus Tectomicrobia bacterium]